MDDKCAAGDRRQGLDRREFVAWTFGAAAVGVVGASAAVASGASGATSGVASAAGAGAASNAAPGAWHDALIINALGDIEDPNPPAGAKNPPGQTQAVQGVQSQPRARDEQRHGKRPTCGNQDGLLAMRQRNHSTFPSYSGTASLLP